VGALVEAARGNLESIQGLQPAQVAGLDLKALEVPNLQAGYKVAYQQAASRQIQPLTAVSYTLPSLMTDASELGNTNFGFVAFNDVAGMQPGQTFTAPNIAADFPTGGTGNFHLPGVHLGAFNMGSIAIALSQIQVNGNRNVARALGAALDQFSNNGRDGAQKAIVLITNGAPTQDLAGRENPVTALADARSKALEAHNRGVPIYCVSIWDNANDHQGETVAYNETNANPLTGGIAGISGQGAKSYFVEYSNASDAQRNLTQVFGNVVRQLCSLMRQ